MEKLSIILLTWNSEQHAANCINSLLTLNRSKEIIVVDNGSTDGTLSILQRYATIPFVRIVKNATNCGVAAGRNTGLKHVTGTAVLLLDIDTEVNPAAIDAMADYIDRHPDCGICACKLTARNGAVQESCRKYPRFVYKVRNVLSHAAAKKSFLKWWKTKIDCRNRSQFYYAQMEGSQPFEVEYVIGACQMMPVTTIERVGLLDENIFYGPEDADFCLRCAQQRLKVIYLPNVSIIHDYQQITSRHIFSRMSRIHTRALFYFFWKHRKRF